MKFTNVIEVCFNYLILNYSNFEKKTCTKYTFIASFCTYELASTHSGIRIYRCGVETTEMLDRIYIIWAVHLHLRGGGIGASIVGLRAKCKLT